MHTIDLGTVLRQTVSCDLYSNLVTRPTGAAIRTQIELMLGTVEDRSLTVIDLTHVAMMDFSCADEIIAKLVLRFSDASRPREAYFVFRGITDGHWEAIEAVVERHGLALVIERAGEIRLIGAVDSEERRIWEAVRVVGPARTADVARALAGHVDLEWLEDALDALCQRRLVMKVAGEYAAVGGGGYRD